jgi:hypothetical protein
LTTIGTKFFRRTARNTLPDHKRSEEIFEEVEVEPVDEKLRIYKSNRLRHATRMKNNRMPKIIWNFIQN